MTAIKLPTTPAKWNGWGLMAHDHWKHYLPTYYKTLQEQGQLDEKITWASETMADKLGELLEGGLHINEAKEILLPQYILLPPEADQQMPQEED